MLSDEEIESTWRFSVEHSRPIDGRTHFRFARAIESAATAPLLERIAELERQVEAIDSVIRKLKQGLKE